MSLPRALAELAAARGVGSWAGTGEGLPIFIGDQPATPVNTISLWVEPDGRNPDPDFDDGDTLGRTADARLLIRHAGDTTGKTAPGQAIAQAAIAALHGIHDTDVTDTRTDTVYGVTQILARNSVPTPLGPDPAGNHEWTVVLSIDWTEE